MKIQLEIDSGLANCEVIIRCPEVTEEVSQLSHIIAEATCKNHQIIYYQQEKEYTHKKVYVSRNYYKALKNIISHN